MKEVKNLKEIIMTFNKHDTDIPKPAEITTKENLINDLSKALNDTSRMYRPIFNLDDGEIYIQFYAGMGQSGNLPLSIHKPFIQNTIMDMYALKELIQTGEPFMQNGCSPLFKELKLDTKLLKRRRL